MPAEVPSQGPRNARVMIVGEAPGQNEVEQGQPFVGPSGLEMTRMLREAGFTRTECYVTNVSRVQPPGNRIEAFFGTKASKYPRVMGRNPKPPILEGLRILEDDIRSVDPDLIIAFGNTALWACTGEWGITKWRASILPCRALRGDPNGMEEGSKLPTQPKVIPTYHPAAVLRNWPWRNIVVQDLRRAKRELDTHGRDIVEPAYRFKIRPTFDLVLDVLSDLRDRLNDDPVWLAIDIETQRRHIDCIGFAWSKLDALCIPFIQMDTSPARRFYWTLDEQTEIVLALREVLTHPNCLGIGQNFPYDQQYFARELGFVPNLAWDTMTMHHSVWCTLPKGLDFLSSLYCDFHRYWKEDAKDTDTKHRLTDEDQWIYNCRDCVVTFEVKEKEEQLIKSLNFPTRAGQTPQERQMSLHEPMLSVMLRGVQASLPRRESVLKEILDAKTEREEWINYVCGHPLNARSPKQLALFFYKDMKVKPVINWRTKKPTCDEKALVSISRREPLLAPLCEIINEVRSLGSLSSVCKSPLDHDYRFRCQYSIPGTVTYRFNSSSDAFSFGGNLQAISSGTEDMDEDELAVALEKGILLKPNLRKLFIPDPGYTIAEYDLPQADAQIVAWECEDDSLKEIFRDPDRDLHKENAITIFGSDAFVPGSDRKKVRPEARQYAKKGVHAANYLVTARTLAMHLGTSIAQAESFLKTWFKAHPNITDWHSTIRNLMISQRYIENIFGYRRYCFDRVDNEIKEAVAWIPQSTTAIITNTGIRETHRELITRGVQTLLQVHDSAAFQFPTAQGPELAKEIQRCMTVAAPYDDPLVMIPDAKFSETSWGEAEKRKSWLVT